MLSTADAQPGSKSKAEPKSKAKKKKAEEEDKDKQPLIEPIPEELRKQQLPSMRITKELITPAEVKTLETQLKKARYTRLFRNGQLAGGGAQLLKAWGKARILGMSLKQNRGNLYDMRRSVLNDIRSSAKPNLVAAGTAASFRKAICEEVTESCAKLLDNNFSVRLNAVLILGQLNHREFMTPKTLPVAYTPAAEVLIKQVLQQKQPEPIRIAAVNGLRRIAWLGEFKHKQKRDLAVVLVKLVKEFKASGHHPWYQSRLLEAMAAVDLQIDEHGKPIIVDVLARVMIDKTRSPQVRCNAAMAIGRAALHKDVKEKVLAYELANLARDMSLKYNADIDGVAKGKLKRVPSHWRGSFFKIYLAFEPRNRLERDHLYKKRSDPRDRIVGLFHRFPTNATVKESYAKVAEVSRHVIGNLKDKRQLPIPTAVIAGVKDWLDKNSPKESRVHPSLSLLRPVKAAALAKPAVKGKAGKTRNTPIGP